MTITELIEQWEKKHTQGMSEIVSLYETKKLTIKEIFSAMFETTNESNTLFSFVALPICSGD